jgi:cystathionine beta-lyase/cystathionine gamma-synthase
MKNVGDSTRSVHTSAKPDEKTGSVQMPIYQTSTYIQDDFGVHKGYEYARTHNPTRALLESAIADLESPNIEAFGTSFSSGMAAITTITQILKAGDHIIAASDLYGGTARLFDQVLSKFGVTTTYSSLEEDDLEKISNTNTKMIWLESPTNPLLEVHDIEKISKIAHIKGWVVVVDNTFASPILQRPLELGADIVVHSTTKYIAGHSDLIGGCVITRNKEIHAELKFLQNALGAIPSPLDCFLTLRSIRTLALRIERHCDNAERLVEKLANHPKVTRLIYPGLKSHNSHEIAKKQMSRFGGMFSLEVVGGEDGARKFASGTKLFATGESLGGVESLINHPWTMTHAAIPEDRRLSIGVTPGLVRLSAGIEDFEDLWEDIRKGLMKL